MKWMITYSRFYTQGKGDPCSEDTIVGYSDLSDSELFVALKKKYPNLPIRKKVQSKEYKFSHDYVDEYGRKGLPYSDFVFFEESNLEEFK